MISVCLLFMKLHDIFCRLNRHVMPRISDSVVRQYGLRFSTKVT
ncbi:hypothetical protein OH687_24470 [Burkholderia anthina]|nr:hypothetical protein OH687_24470 [Burkholderia anthina]